MGQPLAEHVGDEGGLVAKDAAAPGAAATASTFAARFSSTAAIWGPAAGTFWSTAPAFGAGAVMIDIAKGAASSSFRVPRKKGTSGE
jgi:hypothetical protein